MIALCKPIVATTVALALGGPTVNHQPPNPEPTSAAQRRTIEHVRIELDVSGLVGPEDAAIADKTAGYLRADLEHALADHGIAVGDGTGVPRISIKLWWNSQPESIYGIEVTTQHEGEQARTVERFECECLDPELTSAVLDRLPASLEQLREPKRTAAADVPSEPDESPNATGPTGDPQGERHTSPPIEQEQPRVLGSVGAVGIVVAAGGLGLVGVGASRLAKGDERQLGADELMGEGTDYRPAGRAWLGAGIGATATGIALLVVDLTVLKNRRRRRLSATPHVSANHVGVRVGGRF